VCPHGDAERNEKKKEEKRKEKDWVPTN